MSRLPIVLVASAGLVAGCTGSSEPTASDSVVATAIPTTAPTANSTVETPTPPEATDPPTTEAEQEPDEAEEDSESSSPVDVSTLGSRTDFVVSVSQVELLDSDSIVNSGGSSIGIFPVTVVVEDDVIFTSPFAVGDDSPAAGEVEMLDYQGSFFGRSTQRESSGRDFSGELVAGVQVFDRTSADIFEQDYAITFLASSPDGQEWEFVGANADQLNAQMERLQAVTGVSSTETFKIFSKEMATSNQQGSSTDLYVALAESLEEPEPIDDTPVNERDLYLERLPDDAIGRVEAFGLDVRFIEPPDPSLSISLRTSLGWTANFSADIGDLVLLVLRPIDEPVEVWATSEPSGNESQIGLIDDVPGGEVAVVEVIGARLDDLQADVVAVRSPDEVEAAIAQGSGVRPDGSLDTKICCN